MPRAATTKRDKIPIGTVLGDKYRVSREIGRGGMAAVYEAVNVDIGKNVAIKVLAPQFTHSTVVVERFFREARAAAAVKSPYICDVYDAGRLSDDRPFLVLELLRGESLYERMVKVRRLDVSAVLTVFHDVCRGLSRAHEAKIIHRDLKPENIFITENDDGKEQAKILDFGLAKFYEPMDGNEQQQRLTREGAVFGTPAYMSPEQVKGQGQVDHRADLWAAGCMVYESLIGRTVWDTSQGVAMIFAQIATADLPLPSAKRPSLPSGFDDWFRVALARDPDERYQTAEEFWDSLEKALSDQPRLLLTAQPSPVPAAAAISTDALPLVRPPGSAKDESVSSDHLITQDTTPNSGEPSQVLSTAAAHVATPQPDSHRSRLAAAAAGAIIIIAGAALTWNVLLHGQKDHTANSDASPPVASSVPRPPSAHSAKAAASHTPEILPASDTERAKWEKQIREAQVHVQKGELNKAMALLRSSVDGSANPIAAVLLENLKLAQQSKGNCRLVAIGRPRPFDRKDAIHRPCITSTPRGPIVAWVDNHEATGQWHVYTQLLDKSLRSIGRPVDVTPEASYALSPRFFARPEHLLLLYSDSKSSNPGVYVRRLSNNGRISGPPVQVTKGKNTTTWPSLAVAPLGDYWVAYGVDPERAPAARLFLQHITPNIRVTGKPTMVSEYASTHGLHRSRANAPMAVFSGNTLQVVYKLQLGQQAAVIRQSLVPDERGLFKGLPRMDKPVRDRIVGEKTSISDHAVRLSRPSISCDATGCFVAWGSTSRGLSLAYIDSTTGTTIWRKMFARKGMNVTVRSSGSGHALLSWYQGGRVRIALASKDGIGTPSVISRVTGDQASPSLSPAPGPGQWLAAWTDYEAGHLEVYVARAVCHR